MNGVNGLNVYLERVNQHAFLVAEILTSLVWEREGKGEDRKSGRQRGKELSERDGEEGGSTKESERATETESEPKEAEEILYVVFSSSICRLVLATTPKYTITSFYA